MESGPEKLARVQRMADHTLGSWDLSHMDQLALRYVLGLVTTLSNEAAAYSGKSVASIMEWHHEMWE